MKKMCVVLIFLLGLISMEVSGKWFQQKTVYSKALHQDKTYYVGLPNGYNAADTITKYPVIFFLHGASVTASDMVNTLEPFLDNFFTRILLNNLFKVIFVIPDGSCEPYKGSFYTNSDLYGNYEDFITQDMVEEVVSNYHTYKAREKWTIMGHSMGAYGAMKIALKYPQKFIGVSALSGPLNITYFDEMLPVLESEHGSTPPYDFTYDGSLTKLIYSMAGAFSPNPGAVPPVRFPVVENGNLNQEIIGIWEDNNPINLIRKWKGKPAMAIHTFCGEKDEFKLVTPNKMFADTLAKYNLPFTYKQDPNADHVNSLSTSFPQGINYLYHVMDTARISIQSGVTNLTDSKSLSIYPNPATDILYVSGEVDHVQNIVVFNLSGQRVWQVEHPVPGKGIDISALGKGLYVVSLHCGNGSVTTLRMIKQ